MGKEEKQFMNSILEKYEDKFWFLIYIAGSGGEKIIDTITKCSTNFYHPTALYDDKHNKWQLNNIGEHRILHNITTYEDINDKESHLRSVSERMVPGDTERLLNVLKDKNIMAKGHTFHPGIPRVFLKSSFIYLYYDDLESQQMIHKLRFIKNWLPIRDGKFSINALGSSSAANIEKMRIRYPSLVKRIDEHNKYRSFLFDLLIRMPDHDLERLKLGDLNQYDVDDIMSDEFATIIYKKCISGRSLDTKSIAHFEQLKTIFIDYNRVRFLNFRDITKPEVIEQVMSPWNIQLNEYSESLKKWQSDNNILIERLNSKV